MCLSAISLFTTKLYPVVFYWKINIQYNIGSLPKWMNDHKTRCCKPCSQYCSTNSVNIVNKSEILIAIKLSMFYVRILYNILQILKTLSFQQVDRTHSINFSPLLFVCSVAKVLSLSESTEFWVTPNFHMIIYVQLGRLKLSHFCYFVKRNENIAVTIYFENQPNFQKSHYFGSFF